MSEKKYLINHVDFHGFVINMNKNNRVELKYTNNEDEADIIDIGKYVNISIDNGNVDMKIKTSKQMINNDLKVYSRNLIFLETNVFIKKALKEFFSKEENLNKEVFVVKSYKEAYLGEKVDDLSIDLDVLKSIDEQKKLTETEKKENLKAYETPSKVYDLMFSLMQKAQISNEIASIALDFKTTLANYTADIISSKPKEQDLKYSREINKIALSKKGRAYLIDIFKSFYSNASNDSMDIYDVKSDYTKLRNYIVEHFPEIQNEIYEMYNDLFPFTHLTESHLNVMPIVPIIDFQAGSGKGILESATKSKMPMKIQGTELRSLENLGLDVKDLDSRYEVLTGVNFLTHKGDLKSTFKNGSLFKAVINTPIYLNPPYNSDNHIAKESILALLHKQNVFGLFPTSMKNFLHDNLSGHIFEVARELTGYTDPKTPDKFLFVVGRRYDIEHVENMQSNEREKIFLYEDRKSTFYKKIASVDIDSAIKEISRQINMNQADYNFKVNVQNFYQYYSNMSRLTFIKDTLSSNIQTTEKFINNSQEIFKALETKKEYIQNEFGSENMLIKEKVFPNVQEFTQDGKIEMLTFHDVISMQGLLVAYRDSYPEVLSIIEKIAKKENIDLNIQKSFTSLYNLDNPYIPEEKHKKVSKNIGLMKNFYLPSSFSLEDIENKNHLLKIIDKIYSNMDMELNKNMKSMLEDIIGRSSRLVTKLESKIKEEKSVMKDEVMVLIDDDGTDICKLQISKTDFNKALEDLGYFNLDNYIEVAELSLDKKAKVMENFLKHLENNVFLIDNFNNVKNLDEKIFDSLKKIIALKRSHNEGEINKEQFNKNIHEIYVHFMNDNNIDVFFENNVNFDTRLQNKFTNTILKNEVLVDLKPKEKKDIAEKLLNTYQLSPLDFFEFKRSDSEDFIIDLVNDTLKKYDKSLSEKDQKFFKIDVYNTLSQDYVKNKAVFQASLRLSKMLISNYGFAKYKKAVLKHHGKEVNYSELYDELFENISLNTLGLMPHQHETPERFLEISENQKLDMMMWEMRAGKTLGFTNEMYLLSLYREEDGYMMLESKNIDDITLQILSHMPHLFISSNFYLTDSKVDKSIVSSNSSYTHLNMAEYYPNIPTVLKPFYVGKGDMTASEISSFGYEFEELIELVKDKDLTKDFMLEKYKNSPFIDILNISCLKDK